MLAFSVPTEESGVSRWCLVLTGGSSMSRQLSWAPLRMAARALREHAQGHWHTQGRVHSCLLSVWRVLPWFFCTCRLERGFAICLRHGETSRSRITQSKRFGRLFIWFPQRSSMEQPSHMQSDVTPPHPVKENSLHVPSCHGAPQQCAGAVYKRRWMQGSGGGWYSSPVQLCVGSLEGTLSSFMLRPAAEWKAAPCRDLFCPSATSLCPSLAVFGNEPLSLEESMCSRVLDQQLPSPFSGTGVELASGKRLQVCALCVYTWQDIFRHELNLEMEGLKYSVWFG